MEVLPDWCGKHGVESEGPQMFRLPDPGALENRRRAIRPCGKKELASPHFPVSVGRPDVRRDCTRALYLETIDERVSADGEAGAVPDRVEVGKCRIPAHPVSDVDAL